MSLPGNAFLNGFLEVPYRRPCTFAHSTKALEGDHRVEFGLRCEEILPAVLFLALGGRVVRNRGMPLGVQLQGRFTRLDLPAPLGAATTNRLPG